MLFMKLSEFIALPEDHKRSFVLTEGVAIAKRHFNGQMVFLYHLPEFYVETYCCHKGKEIEEYRILLDIKYLTPYLNAIRIDHLLR